MNKFNQIFTGLSLNTSERDALVFLAGLGGGVLHEKMGGPLDILNMATGQRPAPEPVLNMANMLVNVSQSALGPTLFEEKVDEFAEARGIDPHTIDSLLYKAAGIMEIPPSDDRTQMVEALSRQFLLNQEEYDDPVTAGVTCPRCEAFYFL